MTMSVEQKTVAVPKKWFFSLDTWAVLAAFLAALLIRVGAFKHVPW
jgi:hypothetical protein